MDNSTGASFGELANSMNAWRCEICGSWRQDAQISVYTYPLPDLPGGERNLKHCNEKVPGMNCAQLAREVAKKDIEARIYKQQGSSTTAGTKIPDYDTLKYQLPSDFFKGVEPPSNYPWWKNAGDITDDFFNDAKEAMPPKGDVGHDNLMRDLQEIMADAKTGLFHDFKSPKPTPKVDLYNRLTDMVQKVKDGNYDNNEE